MNAQFHIEKLQAGQQTQFRPKGQSMTGKIDSGQLVTFEPVSNIKTLKVGDIVMCKVKGRLIDAHLVTKKRADGAVMISNNHGHDNGWTKTVYGRVIKIED